MTMDDLARLIKNPSIEYRPELRWWLAEGLHTDETLRYEIDTAHRLGFGGMEFLAMDEGDIDHSRYGWGAEEWVHDSQIVVEETTKRNMSVSFTSGTNWSNANLPTIDADHPAAAKELDVVSEDLPRRRLPQRAPCRGSIWRPSRRPTCFPGSAARSASRCLVAVVAARVLEETEVGAVLDVDSVVDLTGRGARRGPGVDRAGRRHVAALHLLDARHRPDRIPLRVGQLHRQLRRPRRRPGGDRLLGLGGAHPRAAGADRPEPPRPDVHGLPRAVRPTAPAACSGAARSPRSSGPVAATTSRRGCPS